MTGASAMSMFAALLDRSVAQIGECAADGRYFDRQAVARVADVWDNNTFPLFRTALCYPAWLRERRARAALVWMADLGPLRRAWMIEQAAVAGHRLEPLLTPHVDDVVHHRDYQGQIRPGVSPLTTQAVAGVAGDYDLDRAEVRAVRVERVGRELSGYLALTSPRRYATPDGHDDAVVQLSLDDVRTVRFDSDDGGGALLCADPTGVEIRVGTQGRLCAASATVWFDDPSWHLSNAGRAADACTAHRAVRRQPRQVTWPPVGGAALDAAIVLYEAMLAIRSVRYAKLVGRVALRELCDAFAGAGERVFTAAGQPRAMRDRAFRKLTEEWITGSPGLAHRIAHRFAGDHWIQAVIPTGSTQPAVADLPTRAQLTLAAYTAAHVQFGTARDVSAVVNLAVPDDDGAWGLRAVEFGQPTRWSLGTAAFTVPDAVSHTAGVSLSLGNGAFAVTCHQRSSSSRAARPPAIS